jgi:hypothetical protein
MAELSDAQMAREESIARRLIIARLEGLRDRNYSVFASAVAMEEILSTPVDPDWWKEPWVGVMEKLTFIAAAALLGTLPPDASDDDVKRAAEQAIEAMNKRLAYLAPLTEEN